MRTLVRGEGKKRLFRYPDAEEPFTYAAELHLGRGMEDMEQGDFGELGGGHRRRRCQGFGLKVD